jgi:hypothetical protein
MLSEPLHLLPYRTHAEGGRVCARMPCSHAAACEADSDPPR